MHRKMNKMVGRLQNEVDEHLQERDTVPGVQNTQTAWEVN